MEQELEQAKRKKEWLSVTPDLEVQQNQGGDTVSDGYQSDGEGSDISTRAEEIAEQVLEDDQCKIICTVLCWYYCIMLVGRGVLVVLQGLCSIPICVTGLL